jgi:hypothetical protein
VFPELPGAGVAGVEGVDVVVPPVDGVFPELPGAGVVGVVGVVPPVDEALPELLLFVETGVDTTVDLTGVVARVTKVAVLRTLAGVGFAGNGVVVALPLLEESLPEDPPPEPPPLEISVHCAKSTILVTIEIDCASV